MAKHETLDQKIGVTTEIKNIRFPETGVDKKYHGGLFKVRADFNKKGHQYTFFIGLNKVKRDSREYKFLKNEFSYAAPASEVD